MSCQVCCKGFGGARKSTLEQHVRSPLYQDSEALKRPATSGEARQRLVTSATQEGASKKNQSCKDLRQAFVSADIAGHGSNKLETPLENYTRGKVPHEFTQRHRENLKGDREILRGDSCASTD